MRYKAFVLGHLSDDDYRSRLDSFMQQKDIYEEHNPQDLAYILFIKQNIWMKYCGWSSFDLVYNKNQFPKDALKDSGQFFYRKQDLIERSEIFEKFGGKLIAEQTQCFTDSAHSYCHVSFKPEYDLTELFNEEVLLTILMNLNLLL